jgi:hypothetical protein
MIDTLLGGRQTGGECIAAGQSWQEREFRIAPPLGAIKIPTLGW